MNQPYLPKTIQNLREVHKALKRSIEKRSVEISNLEDAQTVEKDELEAIEKLLGRWDVGLPESAAVETTRKPEAKYAGDLASLGLRDAIRAVLARVPSGLRPAEIRTTAEAGGFVYQGKTDLTTRISNDCWKMAKSGELINNKGRYRLSEGAT